MVPIILGGIGMVVLVVAWVSMRRSGSTQSLDDRLNEMAALGQSITLEELELSQPFSQRVLIPMMAHLSKMAQRFTPQNAIEASRHKLELAGLAPGLKPVQFLGYRMVVAIVLGLVSFLAVLLIPFPFFQRLMIIIIAFVLGYMLPTVWLRSKISTRQGIIIKALPDALDLLTICVEAGLGFDAAMSKVAEKWENDLSLAFARTVQEMQLGKLRREALRNMSNGMDVPDMTTFVAAIIQADTLGVSMAKVMRIQSDTMRMKRRQRAEEKARQAPVKMMFPLVFFIFPTILIVLLGPAFIQIKSIGSS
jgi:tight adherence protein C